MELKGSTVSVYLWIALMFLVNGTVSSDEINKNIDNNSLENQKVNDNKKLTKEFTKKDFDYLENQHKARLEKIKLGKSLIFFKFKRHIFFS